MRALTDRFDADEARRVPGRMILRASLASRKLIARVESVDPASLPRFRSIAVALLGAAGLYGMIVGGNTVAAIDAVSAPLGFSIETIDVSGNRETTEIDVLQVLWGTGSQTLPSLDPAAARDALQKMPWIRSATVSKIYPDRVKIDLQEYEPYALWQTGGDLFIIDPAGHRITPSPPERFMGLPLVVGGGSAENASEILGPIELLPELRARVQAYIRVGDRRWDLRLDNGVTVRLPEEKPLEAMADVVRMDAEAGLLSRDIAAVDMRLPDRVTVQLTSGALERRTAALKEREKLLKRIAKDKPV